MIAVIYTDGQLDLKAIAEECQANKWVPVLATKPKTDPDATGTVLLFHRVEDAQKFIVMNILSDPDKKDWLFGIIDLPILNLL
jgi:3-polyprenyl-4-hydroxybenzoate decarboxylase